MDKICCKNLPDKSHSFSSSLSSAIWTVNGGHCTAQKVALATGCFKPAVRGKCERARQPRVAVPSRRARARTCRRPVGSARPPTAAPAPARSARAVTRQAGGRWGHFGAEKDEPVAHAGRRRPSRSAPDAAKRALFRGLLSSCRVVVARFYLSLLSRSVHLSLPLGSDRI
jgi:hypothetical protein